MTRHLGSALAHRLRLTGWALLQVIMYGFGVALFSLFVAGLPLVLAAGIGIPLLVAVIWLTRRFTDLHRWFAASALRVPIPRPYQHWPSGHIGRQLLKMLRQPATWRDQLWLVLNSVLGIVVYTLVLALVGGVLWYATLPLLWTILEDAAGRDTAELVLRTDFGIWAIDSRETSYAGLLISVGFLLLWWGLTPPILRGYATLSRTLLAPTGAETLAARVQQLTESRAETVDTQAAELRRIERDLHDGAQARLVALGMSIGMAEELLRTDPDAAARLLAEARNDSGAALTELRQLVRGVYPPVLADRGLVGAVQALVIVHPLQVEVVDALPGRPPAPVESALYFAVSELLTNISKHAQASTAKVRLGYDQGSATATVSDDGTGGAHINPAGGLHGVQRRLSAFDGTVNLTSPPGGPTVVHLAVPCDLAASPRNG